MEIRIMNIEDYDSLYSLWLRTPGMGLNSVDDSREGIEKYLRRNPNTCFVAQDNGRLVGAILSGHDGRRGFISHTAVDSDYRRRGIAKQLVDAVVEAMKNEGICKLALVVFDKNELGNAFWQSVGFTVRNDIIYRNKAIADMERIDT
jgi:ribosomal protein S18 acetylase RimI-like enzyme